MSIFQQTPANRRRYGVAVFVGFIFKHKQYKK